MTTKHEEEGVIKFQADHRHEGLDARRHGALAASLLSWREVLVRLGGVGQTPSRYGGAGFGNVSARVPPRGGGRGRRPFLITGTQTGGQRCMSLDALCVVTRWWVEDNRVESRGPVLPSSEAMTHGAIYDLGPHVQSVLHGHCPELWQAAGRLRLPTTSPQVAYGTVAMAREVRRLWRETPLAERRVLAMGGHEDGVISFGRSPQEAGAALVAEIARAHATRFLDEGRLCSA